MNIKEQLAGNIVLDLDFRKGTIADQSSSSQTTSFFNTPRWQNGSKGKGLFCADTAGVTVTSHASLQMAAGTLVFFGDFTTQNSAVGQRLWYQRDAGGTQIDLYSTTGNVTFYDGAAQGNIVTSIIGSKMMCVTFDGANAASYYQDGLYVGDFTGAYTISANDADIIIGNATTGARPQNNNLHEVLFFNVVLTAQQISQLYNETSTSVPYTAVDFKSKDRYINTVADGMMKKTGTDDWIVDGVGGVLSKVADPERGQVLAVYSGGGAITYAYQYNIGVGYYRLRGWLKGDSANGGIARIKVGGTWMTGSNATDTWQMIDEVIYNPSNASVPFKMGQTAATTSYSYFSDIECIKLNSNNENDFASPRAYIADGKGWNESTQNES